MIGIPLAAGVRAHFAMNSNPLSPRHQEVDDDRRRFPFFYVVERGAGVAHANRNISGPPECVFDQLERGRIIIDAKDRR
jgi:hypothetical protein